MATNPMNIALASYSYSQCWEREGVVVIPDALEMGKNEQQHVQEEGQVEVPPCCLVLLRPFSFKCLFLLLLSLSALLSALFWVLPRHNTISYSFDAKDVIKQSGQSRSLTLFSWCHMGNFLNFAFLVLWLSYFNYYSNSTIEIFYLEFGFLGFGYDVVSQNLILWCFEWIVWISCCFISFLWCFEDTTNLGIFFGWILRESCVNKKIFDDTTCQEEPREYLSN